LALFILFASFGIVRAGTENEPENVFVEVNWSGWNIRLTADGWIGFVAPERRDDLIHSRIDPKEAFGIIDELIANGFFWTLDRYPSRTENLSIASDGTIGVTGTGVSDGGRVSIFLKVGSREKSVVIELPAMAATRSLMEWFDGFEKLSSRELFGK
jgi:hypothetical protein